MKEMKHNIIIILLLILTGCGQQNRHTTTSGLRFKIVSTGQGQLITMGATVKFYISRSYKDSIVYSNFNRMPEYALLVPGLIPPYSVAESLLYNVREGDSLEIIQTGDSLLKKGILHLPLRPGTKLSDEWITSVKVEKVFTADPLHSLQVDSMIAADKKHEKERLDACYKIEGAKHIDEYLRNHHIASNPEIVTIGDGQRSDTAKLFFSLRLFSLDNHLFLSRDSLLFQKGKSGLPLRIDSSLAHYPGGTRLRYYLPAMDAFGAEAPAGIPSYSDLIFDITLKK